MANTYTQLHVQLIFAVKYRLCLIDSSWKEELHKYATGIIQSNQHKVLQVNSMPDHIHILIGLRPHQAISSLVQNVKTETSKWIKDKKFCSHPFRWQEGFGAFSYSPMDVNNVIRYIQNQETHHKKEKFLEEYDRSLNYTRSNETPATCFTCQNKYVKNSAGAGTQNHARAPTHLPFRSCYV